jgi:hypothetical protein
MLYLGLPIKNGWIFPWQTVRHFQTKQLGSAGFVLNGIKLPQGDGLGWFLQAISDKKWRCHMACWACHITVLSEEL